MRVTYLSTQDFRSFPRLDPINIDQVNVLVGPNNAGKSSLLRALHFLQGGIAGDPATDVRRGATQSVVTIGLAEVGAGWGHPDASLFRVTLHLQGGISRVLGNEQNPQLTSVDQIPNIEPRHFIVPYFSKRKAVGYSEAVNAENVSRILPDFTYLAAKLSRLGNPAFPAHARYAKTCDAILGFVVTAIPSPNGQVPGLYLPDTSTLTLAQMGEGVSNIVGLLADLALSTGKLFLIEEPENDLHPHALKALLDLIIESSKANQFIVSTHSQIVVRHLGAASNSRVYYVEARRGVLPTEATVREVGRTPSARFAVLRDLGYSFSDFELWDGWLILEEASAERIVRDYLIPWFTPRLSRVRTMSARSNNQVEPVFEDFLRLVRFTHLEEAYRNRAWILIDGDPEGRAIVERLRKAYSKWSPDRFDIFDQAQFERYYPSEFAAEAAEVLAITSKDVRREEKRKLLDRVRAWLDADEKRGQAALQRSASAVIDHLKRIESQLFTAETPT
jgi:AAA domain, putative AbiEii toxin, Type IV TA system